jgi:hypothetical protein
VLIIVGVFINKKSFMAPSLFGLPNFAVLTTGTVSFLWGSTTWSELIIITVRGGSISWSLCLICYHCPKDPFGFPDRTGSVSVGPIFAIRQVAMISSLVL